MATREHIVTIPASDLEPGFTLMGSRGGLSNIYEIDPSNTMPGMLAVETEHGFLYLDPEEEVDIIEEY